MRVEEKRISLSCLRKWGVGDAQVNGGVDERMIRKADVRAGKSTESQEAHSIYAPRVFSGLGVETKLGNPSMTPTLIATWQASEVVKILLEWDHTLRNKVLVIDLREQFMEIVDLI